MLLLLCCRDSGVCASLSSPPGWRPPAALSPKQKQEFSHCARTMSVDVVLLAVEVNKHGTFVLFVPILSLQQTFQFGDTVVTVTELDSFFRARIVETVHFFQRFEALASLSRTR